MTFSQLACTITIEIHIMRRRACPTSAILSGSCEVKRG